MKIIARLDRNLYGPDRNQRYLWVRLSVPRQNDRAARQPLDLSLVLDRSGSMAGEKIALARQAAVNAVRLLRETDRCALVVYDNEVDLIAPPGVVDAAHSDLISRALQRIDARGSTDLFSGWTRGAEQISDGRTEHLRRVILLTDGLANVGLCEPGEIVRHVRELNLRGVGTSTFGVGRDFDEELLAAMAEAGGGHFYFIEQAQQIPDFLASELGELLSVVARNVNIAVTVSSSTGGQALSLTGEANVYSINDLPMLGGRWQLGDVSELAEIDLLFALELPGEVNGSVQVRIALDWTDAATQAPHKADDALLLTQATAKDVDAAPVDADTVLHVVRIRTARMDRDALKYNRSGEYSAAEKLVNGELDELRRLAAGVPEAQEELDGLRESVGAYAAPMDAMTQKSMHYASYQRRRSRGPGKA